MNQTQACTLTQISRRLTSLISNDPLLQGAWIVGETVDVRVSGGHCYLELVEKDPNTGKAVARARATIWASTFRQLSAQFYADTGQQFRSDLKVMVYASVTYHAVFGLSLNIASINSAYTLGDAMQRRAQMIDQLRREGIIDMNRTLPWPSVPQRIALISARGAAGYGDFINQLYNNSWRLRFTTRLFPAVLQGERAPQSIISALDAIAADADAYDCVVIIRGGGATSDLAAYDDYDLAACIAQYPLPVVIGIGHERDVTLLDYVANMRVKTPTAAAEWLIERGEQALGRLQAIAAAMLQATTDRMTGCHRQLALLQGQLPAIANNVLVRAQKRLVNSQTGLSAIADRRLRPAATRLNAMQDAMRQALSVCNQRQRLRLDSLDSLLHALSPESTLRRGYTLTRVNGKCAAHAADIKQGDLIETVFADGTAQSSCLNIEITQSNNT